MRKKMVKRITLDMLVTLAMSVMLACVNTVRANVK